MVEAVGRCDWDLDGDVDFVVGESQWTRKFDSSKNAMSAGKSLLAATFWTEKTCNRDGIGARVEITLGEQGRTLIKTLRAGDGYLSQSSKWIHFGLGKTNQIHRLAVVWPGGVREEFGAPSSNQRYLARQGTGKLSVVPTTPISLVSSKPVADSKSNDSRVRVLSISDTPMPSCPYKTFDGKTDMAFQPGSGTPVLLNLWASWCQPCIAELTEIGKNAVRIRKSGLDVVALNVDGLGEDEPFDQSVVTQTLADTRFPFRSGRADSRLVEKIQLVNNHLFDVYLPIPVPTSILIDGRGAIAAIYKGPVEIDRLLADVELSKLDRHAKRAPSIPFKGRWHEPINRTSHVPLLDQLTSNGYLYEADDYVRRLGNAHKVRLLPAIVRLGMALYREGTPAARTKAQEHFATVIKMDPKYPGVEIAIGLERETEKRPDSAKQLYELALKRSPNSLRALNNLAWLLSTYPDASIRNGSQAVQFAQRAAQLSNRQDATILDTLACSYAEAGAVRTGVGSGDQGV